ncbi:DNA alkylation repair protein [Flavihumibacter sp. R14]|nr:DNA alkylation repair protein [Flavihumibacter soli]
MNLGELELILQEMADPRALASWQRLNLRSKDRYLGTGMSKLKARAKKIAKDHALAMQCWRSDLYDAKMMACFIDEPKNWQERHFGSTKLNNGQTINANSFAGLATSLSRYLLKWMKAFQTPGLKVIFCILKTFNRNPILLKK